MATVVGSSRILDLPYLPLDASNGVRVQLHESTTGRCWDGTFPVSTLKINTRGAVSSTGEIAGLVHAFY